MSDQRLDKLGSDYGEFFLLEANTLKDASNLAKAEKIATHSYERFMRKTGIELGPVKLLHTINQPFFKGGVLTGYYDSMGWKARELSK